VPNPKLYIVGLGDAPENMIKAAIADQLAASAFNPIDIEIWALETSEVPTLAKLIEIIREEYEGLSANWFFSKDAASLTEGFRHSVAELGDAQRARLLVLWDESTATRQAVQTALNLGIEVYDLSDALTRIGTLATQDNNDKEFYVPRAAKKEEAQDLTKVYTEEELLAMETEEITPIAEAYGIDHESFPDWESVITIILEKQGEADGAEPEPEGEEEPVEGYTLSELQGLKLETLKEICKANEIAVEGQRPRAQTYIDAILEAQGGAAPEPEASDEPDAGTGGTEAAEQIDAGDVIAELLNAMQGDLAVTAETTDATLQAVQVLSEGLDKALKAINDKIANLTTSVKELGSAEPVANGSTPAKAVAAKKVPGVRKLVRPGA
jgi:hypothetical protein